MAVCPAGAGCAQPLFSGKANTHAVCGLIQHTMLLITSLRNLQNPHGCVSRKPTLGKASSAFILLKHGTIVRQQRMPKIHNRPLPIDAVELQAIFISEIQPYFRVDVENPITDFILAVLHAVLI